MVSSLGRAEGHKHSAFSPVNIIESIPGVNYLQNLAIAFCFGEGYFSFQKEKPQ